MSKCSSGRGYYLAGFMYGILESLLFFIIQSVVALIVWIPTIVSLSGGLEEHSSDNIKVASVKESAPVTKKQFFIQVGAFGLHENAEQQRIFLATQDIHSSVVERVVNDKTLFCVWIDGKTDLDKTLAYANRIKQKFDLNYQIMTK